MHYWGDDWEYWDDLYKAINEISTKLRCARIGAHTKEKYGTMRVDFLKLWDGTIQSLIWPGYVRIMGWKWFYFKIDRPIIKLCFRYTGVQPLVQYLQFRYLKFAFNHTIKKYPHIKEELSWDINHQLKGGI